jgi:hypothetical protein
MTVRYWIGVVASDHVDAAVNSGICAFSHGKKTSLAKLSEGDRFAYYSPKTGYMSGDPVQCFTALGTIIDPTPFEYTWDGIEIWAAKAAYAKVTPTSVRPLLEPLKFVSNPARLGMAFRRGQFEITEPDFTLIETAMKANKG